MPVAENGDREMLALRWPSLSSDHKDMFVKTAQLEVRLVKRLLVINLLLVFTVKVFAGGLVISDLPTTDQEGQYPVCFNEVGKLLPCSVETPTPPGEPQTLDGLWVGSMVAEGSTSTGATCYDADVVFNVEYIHSLYYFNNISLDREDGAVDNFIYQIGYSASAVRANYYANSMRVFTDTINFHLFFNDYGYAEGSWSEEGGGCYGSWSFLKR